MLPHVVDDHQRRDVDAVGSRDVERTVPADVPVTSFTQQRRLLIPTQLALVDGTTGRRHPGPHASNAWCSSAVRNRGVVEPCGKSCSGLNQPMARTPRSWPPMQVFVMSGYQVIRACTRGLHERITWRTGPEGLVGCLLRVRCTRRERETSPRVAVRRRRQHRTKALPVPDCDQPPPLALEVVALSASRARET
jgi:hypothetical protein